LGARDLGLTRNIAFVSLAVGLLVIGFNLSTSLLVIYLSRLGLDVTIAGSVITVARLALALVMLPSGVVVHKLGHRAPVVWSFAMCTASLLLMALTSDPLAFSLLVVLLFVGSAMYGPPIASYISRASVSGRVALAFGWFYSITTLAQVTGQTFSGLIAQLLGYRAMFALGGLISLGALVIVTLLLKGEDGNAGNHLLMTLGDFREGMRFFLENGSVRRLTLSLTFHSVGFLTSYTFVPLVASVDQGFDEITIGLLLATWSVGNAILQIPFGGIADRLGGYRILFAHVFLSSAIWWVYPFVKSLPLAFAVMAAQGLVGAMDMPARRLMMKEVSEEDFAKAVGVLDSVTTLAGSAGPFIAGVLWNYGHWVPFAFGSLINLLSLVLLTR
jgi:MFS family permease